MRRIFLTLVCFLWIIGLSYAQRNNRVSKYDMSCPKLYIGISTGIENQSGLLGFNLDVPVTAAFSLGAGFGLGSWGYKSYAEGRFYFGKCNRGWALGAGATYNTGLTNFKTTMPTVTYGDQDVTMNLNPCLNAFLAGYRFWNLGKNGHRIYLEVGYSHRFDNTGYYDVLSFHTLTSEGKSVMKTLAPGGLIIAVGFSFGVMK